MSSEHLSVDALESIRFRLSQLTHSITSLLHDLHTADPLPSWPTITSQLTILNSQLTSLSTSISNHAATLSTTTTFPLSKFPARTQENLLTLLLRKKLSPEVEEWVVAGQKQGRDIPDVDKDSEDWALTVVLDAQNERRWDEEYTLEELRGAEGWKGVQTGLVVDKEGKAVRKGDVGSAAGGVSSLVNGEVPVGGLRLEQMFRFTSSGVRPG